MAKEQDAAAVIAEMREMLAAQAAQLAALQASNPGTAALALLAERSAPVNNPNYNETSVFTYPEGERVRPKPALTRATFFCGTRVRSDELTPQEIDAYNAITVSRTARHGTWTATVTQNGNEQELRVMVPSRTVDERMELPGSLLLILRELKDGKMAVDPLSLAQEVSILKEKLAALEAA
jgi:hypothetical protein